ncbi:hypothetical protein U9M48_027112 [Paspalum notatum var. saurae]|uniref:Uncharacterized protein n=1 Tax=Paspalum notatum var. saurae TaxID=547442 RepID=A0AAQ3TYT0_PASNO
MGHQFGADGNYNLARRMEHQSGVPPSFMDVFVRGHRGPDPTNPEVLCTEAAREKMMAYGKENDSASWVCLWHRGCRLRPEYIASKEIGFVVWEFSLLKDSSRYPGRGGGSCSTRGGSSSNTNGRTADKHDSLHGFLPTGADRVGATTLGLATTSRVDDGTTGLPATSRVDDGTPGLPDTSGVDGTAGLGAISGVHGTAGALGHLPVGSHGMDDTPGLPATFGVDASYCTTLQPVDAIISSAIWITGFGLTPSWPNSRCGRK